MSVPYYGTIQAMIKQTHKKDLSFDGKANNKQIECIYINKLNKITCNE